MLETIIDLVKSGQLGLKKASRDFGIPLYSTLEEKIRGRSPVKAGLKFLLHPDEEKRIMEWLKVYAQQALPRSIDVLRKKSRKYKSCEEHPPKPRMVCQEGTGCPHFEDSLSSA
ncbi:hypothetical protein ElyMa_006477400 [Elysia marginata]|uniref:HTH psq-type domain-containing protein n=1 Tax=Elysia marginata TaxID=1093978 RepID=A0AAV4I4W8_9GAST|nr:hypothetical protein ElyMa_006477400 [Elysia marginata]